jgi:hypothetical protein
MDKVLKVVNGVGEVGIDTNASPGNGPYYVKHYATGYEEDDYEDTNEEPEDEEAMLEDADDVAGLGEE